MSSPRLCPGERSLRAPVLSDRSRISPFRFRVRTIRALLAFWAALHARARLLLRAALRVHSVGRFVRALAFRLARPVVRLDEGRSHHFRLSRLSRGLATAVRKLSLPLGWPSFPSPFGLRKRGAPVSMPREKALASSRALPSASCTFELSLSTQTTFRRSRTFVLRAELRGGFSPPRCSVLWTPQPFGFLGCFRTSSITRKTSRSPRGSRDVLRVLASAFTYDASRSPFGSHVGSHVFTFAELSLLEHACLLGRPRTFALRAITQTRSPFGGSLARGHDAPFEARA